MKKKEYSYSRVQKEKIVPYLQERFKNVLTTPERKGFTFEETGAFVDRIKVTAPNGKTIVISADNFFEKNNIKSTNQFNAFMLENSGGMSTEAVESTYENKLVNDLVNIQEGNTLTEEQKLQAREDAENDFAGGFFAGIGEKAREFGLDLITQQSGLGLSPTTSQNLGRIVKWVW